MTTEELDNRSCDQLALCDKISEKEIKTVQREPKATAEDAEPKGDRKDQRKLLANQRETRQIWWE